jgi:hypothetical protein
MPVLPPKAHPVTIWEDQDLAVMARVKGIDDQDIVQSTISGITMRVYDAQDDFTQVGATATLTVAQVVFDTLQTSNGWTKDSNGYNFRYVISGAYFPTGNRDYWVEFEFTPATGSAFPLAFDVSVVNRRGS